MSDFDDIFILFMKMEMKYFSRLGSKHQQKQFWGPFSSCNSQQIQTLPGFNFFMTQHVVVLLIMVIESAISDVNGPKKKICF